MPDTVTNPFPSSPRSKESPLKMLDGRGGFPLLPPAEPEPKRFINVDGGGRLDENEYAWHISNVFSSHNRRSSIDGVPIMSVWLKIQADTGSH